MSGSFMARVGLAGYASGVILLYSLAVLPPLPWLMSAMVVPFVTLMATAQPVSRTVAVLVAGGLAGMLWSAWQADMRQQSMLPTGLEGELLEVSGYVCDVPSSGSFSSVRFAFCVDQWHLPWRPELPEPTSLPQKIRLAWYGEAATTSIPHRLRLEVVLKRPHGSVNPVGFRYESWLYRKGFGATGTIRDLVADSSVDCSSGCHYHRWRNGLVAAASERLARARHFPLIASLMIGYRGHMEPRHWDVLKATGTIHLVAISGLHLGLIAAGAGFVCRRLLLCLPQGRVSPGRLRGIVFFCVAAASFAYALAAGFSVPTRRALIMVLIAGWVLLGARRAGAFTGLLGALVLVLLGDPFSPLDQGFWLSFAAVSVLVLLFSLRLRQAGWFRGLLLAQLAVFVALWPILEMLGQPQAVVGFVANLFAIPWVSLVVMPVLVLGALIMAMAPVADEFVISVFDLVFGVLWQGLIRLADMEVVMPGLGAPTLALLAVVVMVALLVPFRGFRLATVGLAALWATVALVREVPGGAGNTPVDVPELWVWDVGQGLSVMVRDRQQVLIYDTGPALEGVYSAVDSVLVPNLRELGVHHIDTLVISHGDGDHAGGLLQLFDSFDVGQVITGEPERVTGMLADVSGVTIKSCAQHEPMVMGSLDLLFWRSPGNVEGNDASCVLTIRSASADAEVVLPGDITRRAENRFTAGRRQEAAAFRIVLAPHHGSITSSSEQWVRGLAPDMVVFSAGYRHRFGHPHPDVVGRYLSAGSRLLNTATSGAVRMVLQRDGVSVTEARAHTPFWIRKPESR
ncbi:DNA internalization-related competence protein ComEC/Rec2 [Marinobacter orientalis]|uniref:DNA internalization-related competence protein ComEC/Rec2 n=1 Tax=Marinobacter orientalis TaxID=1928859 RepID=A0A7Y0WSI4_9GAMM|nr:DNA internalization-related competence protein ComEC/Rec2 [Marinobacter orientalis]NMT63924.1 DNA internalization-related competence protein ComEC/Rec2 [Marinobacter orientalis]TGX50022.1 DNA internalization-related competence protein ComEC/Rec2 [Marinobacter orientalis]